MCHYCKDKKFKKKCKKCKTIIGYYDISNTAVSEPIQDVYVAHLIDQSGSVFTHADIYSDPLLALKIGTVETTNKILTNTSTLEFKVVSNINMFLSDGVTSMAYQIYYSTKNVLPFPPTGTYNNIAYSTTGILYNKICYVKLIIPDTGTIWNVEIKVCDIK
jgi:hypothetical protein